MLSNCATLFFSLVLLFCITVSTSSSAAPLTVESVDAHSSSIYPELLALRRDLFAHPEASGHEKRTSEVVAGYLSNLGLEVKENIGGYGVVGILRGGQPGKHIAWRADMDAAQFQFEDHNGDDSNRDNSGGESRKVAHVCGHDVHTTIALGIANTLSQDRESLMGTVSFLFQPAEESQQGAIAMIDDGLFDLINPDEIYALHVAPMKTGVIMTSSGNVYAHARNVLIEFDGIRDRDALYETIATLLSSQNRLASAPEFVDLQNTSDPKIGLGNPDTIYQNYVLFGGSPRIEQTDQRVLFRAELFASEQNDIAKVVANIESAIRATKFNEHFLSISVSHDREGVNNDPVLVDQTMTLLTNTHGPTAVQESFGVIPFASEDFGHFQKHVPGVYFFMGVASEEKGNVAFPHMPNFEVDEASIEVGVSRFSTLILSRLTL